MPILPKRSPAPTSEKPGPGSLSVAYGVQRQTKSRPSQGPSRPAPVTDETLLEDRPSSIADAIMRKRKASAPVVEPTDSDVEDMDFSDFLETDEPEVAEEVAKPENPYERLSRADQIRKKLKAARGF